MMRQREDFPNRKVENLSVRRKRQAAEATEAMRDYLRAQYAAREQLALLRQERLARESQEKN